MKPSTKLLPNFNDFLTFVILNNH